MRKIAALAFSIALFASAQNSQPPSPAPTKTTQNDQRKTSAKQAVAAEDQRISNALLAAIDKFTSEVAPEGKAKRCCHRQRQPVSRLVAEVEHHHFGYRYFFYRCSRLQAVANPARAPHTVMKRQARYIRRALEANQDRCRGCQIERGDLPALQRDVMDTQAGYIGSMLTEIKKSAGAAESSAKTTRNGRCI